RYRAIIELGRGGFGVTYQINEIAKNQTKVLKVLTNNQPKAIELFKQEAAVLSQLNHPGIPKVEPDAYFVYFPYESRNPIHCFWLIISQDFENFGLIFSDFINLVSNTKATTS
ncbi:MAG: hypothetical protein ACKO90_13710, partial [Microcystis panniformis]